MKLEAASSEEKVARDRLTHREWGKNLSIDQYLVREQTLGARPWAQDGMTTWLLRDEQNTILASCETYKMNSCTNSNGRSQKGHTYGVASVFTEPSLRGHGYAGETMSRLNEKLRETDPLAQAIILYSEIGDSLYKRSGYEPCDSWGRFFKAESRRKPRPSGLRLLTEAELYSHHDKLQPPSHPFCIWPSAAQLDWHFAREGIYSNLLSRSRPRYSGAALEDASMGWTVDFKYSILNVLFFRSQSSELASELIAEARDTAASLQIGEVRIWEKEEFGEWNQLSVTGERRYMNGFIAMIHPIVPSANAKNWKLISSSTWI